MNEAFVFQVGSNLMLKWGDIRKNVSMSYHHTAGFGRCPRGEYDFERVISSDQFRIEWGRLVMFHSLAEFVEKKRVEPRLCVGV